MTIGLVLACACAGASACGSDETAPSPPPLSTSSSRPPPMDAGEAPDAFVLTPTPAATMFAGTLAQTEPSKFGGDGYCNYEMVLRDVAVQLELLGSGEVGQSVVRDLAVEKAIDCPYPPMDPSLQEFTKKRSAVTTTGTRIEYEGAAANRPQTSLVVELGARGDGGYDATATWTRTDQGPPLAWTVTAKVNLVRK